MGKYSGRESDLPQREHPDGYVPFREPQDMKKMAIILSIVSLIIIAAFYLLIVLRAQKAIWNIWGILLSLICTIPHEFLHGICFKETVYMYTSLKQGMLFVVGPEDMTKTRFVFM